MNTTVRLKASEITKEWRVIDAAGRPLGRVASEAAVFLRGKHKPTFEPHLDGGDFVIVVNAAQVRLTGRKASQIEYHTHSGYPGGLKTRTFAEQFARFPERVVEQAVWGMLPDGPLGRAMLRHLKVYRGPNHPHQSQVVGSERARAARQAAAEAAGPAPLKVRPLRALPKPDVPSVVEEYPAAEAAIAAPPPRPDRLPEPVALPADESSASADALLAPETVEEAPERKARARRTKTEVAPEPSAEAAAAASTEPKKPRRRTAKTEE
ncbi:MAG: 50S ribosomal protein L13 [Dehalococcoidia bacterium]|nr:50S ribosomal protein L13 [Dehalococcoidia bacterium]